MINEILNIGQDKSYSLYLNSKIRICNVIAFYNVIINFVYTFITWFLIPELTIITVYSLVCCGLSLFLNAFRYHNLARMLVTLGPSTGLALFHASLISNGAISESLYMAQFAILVFPFVLLDFREKYWLLATVIINISLLIFQPYLNELLDCQCGTSFVDTTSFIISNYILASVIIIVCFFSLVYWNKKNEEELIASKEAAEASFVQLKNAQEKIIQQEKMAALGVLTAGVAHEINNPLHFILGGYTGLKKEFKKRNIEIDDRMIVFLSGIKTGVDRASNIVKGLSLLSRDSKSYDEGYDVNAILDNCLTILRNKYKNRIEIKREYSKAKVGMNGNISKLHKLFINLLLNAIDAMPKNGEISISTDYYDDNCIVIIKDTGSGISLENLSKIKDPFFTTKKQGEGTGLGLSIANQIVHDHKGEMIFKSLVHSGTQVTIKLPNYI